MKNLLFFLTLLFPLSFAAAQTVTLDSVSKKNLCVGDSLWVHYSSRGTFGSDNFFFVQLSDANGSFISFTNAGHSTAAKDSIPVPMKNAGAQWKVRVVSSDPYGISSDTSANILVLGYPSPNPVPDLKTMRSFSDRVSFIGDSIGFHDGAEPAGSTYLWKFDQDANVTKFINSSPVVTYSTAGLKSGSLSVSNSAGCLATKTFEILVLSCNPVIPSSAHIVTGTESGGKYPYVWVKAGGSYTISQDYFSTVFAEPGAVVHQAFGYALIYLRNGASLTITDQSSGLLVLHSGNLLNFLSYYYIDTVYCNDLQFDYSQITGQGVELQENPLQITTSPNNLYVTNEGANISATISNLLGIEVLSKKENDILDIDLSSLPNGAYFVKIISGNHHEMRKITVIH